MKKISTITRALLLVSIVVFVQPQRVWSRDDGMQMGNQARTSSTASKSLNQELAALRTKVARLEAALKENHRGKAVQGQKMSRSSKAILARQPAATNATPKKKEMKAKDGMNGGMKDMSGMGGMKSGKKMGKKGMKSATRRMRRGRPRRSGGMMGGNGMGMMGRMPKMAKMATPSTLPGYPGASHIYHIGSTGFFLDHPDHITLSEGQETKLSQYKEQALLKQATFTRQIEEAEQELWVLTSSDVPNAAKINAQVRKIAKLQGDQRIAFIRATGDAAAVLTDEQRKTLVGQYDGE